MSLQNRPSPSAHLTDTWITGSACVLLPPLERHALRGVPRASFAFQVWPSLPREGLLPGLLAGEPARLRHTGKVCASRGELRVLCSGDGQRSDHSSNRKQKTTSRLYRAPTRVLKPNASVRFRALAFAFFVRPIFQAAPGTTPVAGLCEASLVGQASATPFNMH